ncbi:MAG: betaine--homocysteine S-methyltransferase [Geminicoccaceae bacterium]
MSRLDLNARLEEAGVLLADGGMGTGLFAQGLQTGGSPELWNVEQPERVQRVIRGFVDAGADIVLTNSFGANRYRLVLHEAADRVGELNAAAVACARAATDGVGRPVLVAGSMGPTGEIFEPVGALAYDDGVAAFRAQAEALAEAGADLLWIETISAAEELRAAVEGAASTGLPVCATLTFDTNGRTMMGLTPAAAVALRNQLPVHMAAFGANCGIGPAQLVDTVLDLAAAAEDGDVLIAKGNCGIPEYKDGAICYSGTPEIMAAYARLARDAGARIIGGCCGTTPVHLSAMAETLASTERGPKPSRADVEAWLGPIAFSGETPQPSHGTGERRNRRRRRED